MTKELAMGMRLLKKESMRKQLQNSFGRWLRCSWAPGSLLLSALLGALTATALNSDKLSTTYETTTPIWPLMPIDCETELNPTRPQRTSLGFEEMLATSNINQHKLSGLSTTSQHRSETYILGMCHHGSKPHRHRLNLEESNK